MMNCSNNLCTRLSRKNCRVRRLSSSCSLCVRASTVDGPHTHTPRSMRENSFTSWHRHARHTHKPSSTISFCTTAPPTSSPMSMRSVGAVVVVVVRCLLIMSRKHSRGHHHTHKQSSANDVRRTAHIITLRTAIVRTYDYTPSRKKPV